ncbi:MAG: hypothetical protein BGO78_02295 [Chloroflexi bacterium 44-23]|nr:MAG: hypothetical protein BGO78_02295 [Chloroflexi bacterium 44-23]
MNQKQIDKKVQNDVDQVKKGLSNLVEDKTVQVNKIKDNLTETTGKVIDNLTEWIGDSTSQLGKGFDKLTVDAKETIVDSARMVEKDVKKGLNIYNEKAQKVADLVPGGFSDKVAKYPWVAISIGLAVGLILGQILKPARQSFE